MNEPRKWTREHDAVIAEKVEGLDVRTNHFSCGIGRSERNKSWVEYSNYNGDPIPAYNESMKACLSALETWREAGPGRYWIIESKYHSTSGASGEMACRLRDPEQGLRVDEYGPQAIAWALYYWAEDSARPPMK